MTANTSAKSTAVTNRDATPAVLTPAHMVRGIVYQATGVYSKVAGDGDGSIIRFARVRSSDRIVSAGIGNVALSGCTDCDLGFYRTAADGGAVVGVDKLFDGQSMASARATPTNLLGAGTNGVPTASLEMRVWELLGLTSDPQVEYDVALTMNTAGSAAGAIALHLNYCAGN